MGVFLCLCFGAGFGYGKPNDTANHKRRAPRGALVFFIKRPNRQSALGFLHRASFGLLLGVRAWLHPSSATGQLNASLEPHGQIGIDTCIRALQMHQAAFRPARRAARAFECFSFCVRRNTFLSLNSQGKIARILPGRQPLLLTVTTCRAFALSVPVAPTGLPQDKIQIRARLRLAAAAKAGNFGRPLRLVCRLLRGLDCLRHGLAG